MITLKVDDGSEKSVLIKEIQTDPLRDSLIHADFQEIDLEKPSRFSVPIIYSGKPKGEELGGIKQIDKTSLLLEGKPLDIPDGCNVDIKGLSIGDKIKAADIKLPEGVTLVSDPETVCISLVSP